MVFTIGAPQCLLSSSSNERFALEKTHSWFQGGKQRNTNCFIRTHSAQRQLSSLPSPHLPFVLLASVSAEESRKQSGPVPGAPFLFAAVLSSRYLGQQGYELHPSLECHLPLCLTSASYLLFVQNSAEWMERYGTYQVDGCQKKFKGCEVTLKIHLKLSP